MLRAQELGVIALEDSIAMPFPVENPHLQGREVTYLDLAHHMSGIVDSQRYDCAYVTEGGAAYLSPDDQTFCPDPPVADLETFLAEYLTPEGSMYGEDNFADVTTYAYSNVGAALAAASLGRATEAALGLDFIAFCDAEVFEPLSMDHTRWTRDALPDPEAAAIPHVFEDGFVPMPRYDLATYPDGALYSSVDDLARYLAAIVPGRGAGVLESESVDALLMFVDPGEDDSVEGQGVFWERYFGLVGHTGGDPGVATAIGYDPETEVGFVLLLNSTGPNTETLMLQVFDALLSFAEMM